MAHKTELDAVDRKILRAARDRWAVELSGPRRRSGVVATRVMERVKRLEEAGYITGYGARVDRVKAGFPGNRLRRSALTPNPTTSATSHGCGRWKSIRAFWNVTTSR